ncbi:1,4-Dihydroxy-2-naphthoyl-CoA synthase [Archaeoglobus sulfaticallidus PM70-1]|uniref:1,4-dihydroxy-2-naphthoyl-CoA synthase n=1 Tax=Archaeoglobus sulfaticallidus PM70-1 TaxID=387631 RepID=N0BLS5_9EURY|nr:enoyl-CoA hydratase-related protein [Archaeoglobus sulfaticallidus]AGK61195.1 1,4-Dihydroxy-2-naphthoyl-CoA synthase [Archaeoglobus sulfaticallidus PM70-1]
MSEFNFKDIIYEKKDRIATITINRPGRYNACRPITIYELTKAFIDAWADKEIGVVVFTGAGDKAFCTGGDQSIRDVGGYKGDMKEYRGTIATLPLEVGWQFVTFLIRHIPKPVIARVNGYAIGGGHVWQVNCDLSIASETAKFGQAGPRVGSFDPGFGTGDLWRNVGLKKAKEIWYLCRIYTAQEALEMGLVNKVVPPDKLDEEVRKWCDELLEKSPTALKMLKYAFLAETDGLGGITELGVGGLSLYYMSDESVEGRNAFMEKRMPDFWKYYLNLQD